MCDHEMRIKFVDARYPGACHDSHVWNLSAAKQYLEEQYNNGCKDCWVLGDSGYPLEPWLMTPFRSTTEGTSKSRYNSKHSKTRNIVERTIGLLKNRFRCLLGARLLHYSPEKAAQIINVCCAIHNICIYYNCVDDFEPNFDEENEEYDEIEEQPEMSNNSIANEAKRIRDRILNDC